MKSFIKFLVEERLTDYAGKTYEYTKEDFNIILKSLKLSASDVRKFDLSCSCKNIFNVSIDFNTSYFKETMLPAGEYDVLSKKFSDRGYYKLGKEVSIHFNKFLGKKFGRLFISINEIDEYISDLKTAQVCFEELCKLISNDIKQADVVVSSYNKLKDQQFKVTYNNGLLKILVLSQSRKYHSWQYNSHISLLYDVKKDKKMLGCDEETYDYKDISKAISDMKFVSSIIKKFK